MISIVLTSSLFSREMRLPLKTQYACQVMAQLARTHSTGNVRTIEDLAAAEALSANYLVQILNELRSAGLVISKRGKNGGYQLARDPQSITLAEIVCALEGEPVVEASPGNGGMAAEKVCGAWDRVNEGVLATMQGITLLDLVPEEIEGQNWVI